MKTVAIDKVPTVDKVLAIDVGGTHVKLLVTDAHEPRKFASGPELTPEQMVKEVQRLTADWSYSAVSIGFPGLVVHGRIAGEPQNLGPGWVGFDFGNAFGHPVRIINDAAMQALGSFRQGTLLFLGLGTGLGAALVVDGKVLPTELAHLPYRDGSFENYVGKRALARDGKKKWRKRVADVVARLSAALLPDEVVLGGGNVSLLKQLPPMCRAGSNAKAFDGGFRLWDAAPAATRRKSLARGDHR